MEQHRLEKCNKLREMGLNPYVNSHIITSTIANILEKYSSSETELPESEEFSAAGRILAKREFGKTAFLTIRDRSGIIQVYIKKALLSEEEFEVYTLTDIGDFIGVKGTLFRTKTGELTIRAFHYRLLTKTLRDLPEKFHGLKDVETRYRQRYLDLLVVGGIERVFELNRNFRNEGVDTKHNPEFTMIEWYMAYADYHTLMDMIEELVTTISQKINNTLQIQFGDLNIDLQRPWARLTMAEAIEKYGNISQDEIADYEKAKAAAEKLHIQVDSSWGHGKIISEIFEITAEEKLINPAFIIDYPKEISPLSKSKESNPELTDRFELFIAGMELSNGFNELNDPVDQEERFQKQVDSRNAGDEEACMMDEDYIRALEYGLPPTAGAGMGIDRLVMLLTNQVSIRDVLLFPYMRSED